MSRHLLSVVNVVVVVASIYITFGYLQRLGGSYIMERVFIKVNENIETHIAAGKGRTLSNLTDKTLKNF